MAQAVLYGVIASSALVLGAVVGVRWRAPEQITGVLLAFASGALVSALAFELFADAYEEAGPVGAGLGLLGGALAFVVANALVDRRVAGSAKPDQREKLGRGSAGGIGFALLAAVTLDGVPENLALGVSLIGGASATLLVAIFVSNLPEALVGAMAMREEGRSTAAVLAVWGLAAVLLAAAVVIGRVALAGASEDVLGVLLAFAGGAVLASLADTLMPEAFEHGRPYNSLASVAGFFLSFVLGAG